MMRSAAEGFYISSNANQGYVLPISNPTKAPFCPFQSQLKARLSCCLRLFKTQGSASPWKHTSSFAFPFPNNLKFLFTFRRLKARLSCCHRLSKTQGSTSPWKHKGSSSPLEDFKGFAFPFPSYQWHYTVRRAHGVTRCLVADSTFC